MSDAPARKRKKFSLAEVMPVRANVGAEMPIRHAGTYEIMHNEDGSVASITLLGQTSDAFNKAVVAINRMRVAKELKPEVIQSPEHVFETDTDLLVACTIGWNFDELDPGEPFPYSKENARKLWLDKRFAFLRSQATSFMLSNGNFLPQSSASSSDTQDTSSESTNPSPDLLAA